VPVVPESIRTPIRQEFLALLPDREISHAKAPSGGECAGQSPVDRGKRGLKRSQLTDGYGIPVITVPAGANIRDHTLLPETLNEFAELTEHLDDAPQHPALSLDAGYDYQLVYTDLAEREITPRITKRGTKTPIQTDGRWVVERVRREALVDRVEVRDLHQLAVAAVG